MVSEDLTGLGKVSHSQIDERLKVLENQIPRETCQVSKTSPIRVMGRNFAAGSSAENLRSRLEHYRER